MEPVFDSTGRIVAWLRGDGLLDPAGRHVAFLRGNWVISYPGSYRGRLTRGWFRDLNGAAVGFIRGARGAPKTPATESPPQPPVAAPAPMPRIMPIPPVATVPMPVWSRLGWHEFLGRGSDSEVPGDTGSAVPAAAQDTSAARC